MLKTWAATPVLESFILLFLTFAFFPHGALGKYNMSVSGGGIISPGETITLKASIGSEFDRCYWYFPPKLDDYCIFGDKKVIRCSNDEFKAKVNYTGSDPNICEISYNGGKDMKGGDFECSIDGVNPRGKISVNVASKISKIEVLVGNETEGFLEAGKMGPVFCILKGGMPIGESNITFSQTLNITSDETSIIEGSKGEKTSSHKVLMVPTVNDHGTMINCTGYQYNNEVPKKLLFEPVHATDTKLVIVFPPQPIETITFPGTLDEELKVLIPVHSNPSPSSFKWMAKKMVNGSETSTELTNGDAYKIPKICSYVMENQKNCSITFTKLSKEDVVNVTYVLHVENKFGDADLSFKIQTPETTTLAPSTSTPTPTVSSNTTTSGNATSGTSTSPGPTPITTPSPEGGGISSYVIPLVIFIVIIVVLIGGMIAYKRYSAKRQTAPLSMQ